MINFNLIGAGRLGRHIAHALTTQADCRLQTIYQRYRARAEHAIDLLGCARFVQNIDELPCVPLTIITTPDDTIPFIAHALAASQTLQHGNRVIHMSGSLNSEVLAPLRAIGCQVGSFHPLKAFSETLSLENAFQGCDVVYEGDAEAIDFVKPLFEKLGACLVGISPADKVLYHAGAVMASNYLVTLVAQGIGLMTSSGIDENLAHKMVVRLMQTSLDNVRAQPVIEKALTGPLARGDLDVIARHLHAITDPVTHDLYCANLLATLPLTGLKESECDILKKWVKE